MAAPTFIFGADGLPKTPQEAARLRAIAQAMAPQGAPKNVGEGLTSLGNAIAYRMMMNKAAKGDAMGQNAASSAFSALMSGFGGGGAPASSSVSNATPAPSTAPTPTNQPPIPGIQAQQRSSSLPSSFLAAVDRTEGAGGYDTLYGHAQKNAFAGTDVSKMPIGDVLAFTDPSGAYAQSVKGQIGRVATPVGRYQVVGTTLRKAVDALGLDPSQPFDPATQDRVAAYLATERVKSAGSLPEKISALRSEWHGFKGVPDSEMAQIVADLESGGGAMAAMSAQPGMAATANIPMSGAAQEISGNVPGYVDPMVSAPNSRKPVAEALAKTQPLQPVQTAAGGGRQGIMAALMGGQPQTQDMPTDYFPAAPSAPGVSGPSPQQIMQVLTNPYASPEQKAIAQDMYQQMQQSRDPMRQLEMQKMQLELQQMQNPQQVRVLTADEKKSLGLPVSGAFQVKRDGTIDQIGGGGVNITNEGTIPAGYRAVRDAEGRVMAIEPLPGSPAAAEAASVADKKDKATAVKETAANVVMQDIDRAFTAMDEAVLPTTGFVGDLLSNVGGTAANDIRGLTQTVKANASFDKLQQMREASPTGGALGAVSDTELGLLSAAIGNLEQSQSGPQFRDNLARVYNIYADIIHGPGKGPQRKPLSFETDAPKPADTPPPAGMDKEIWDVMTPEERALWK